MHPIPQTTDYRLIGKLLLMRMPEVAEDLLTKHHEEATKMQDFKPLETDHGKIFLYFIRFCKLQKKDPTEFFGYLRDKSSIEARMEFVGALLHIYSPIVFVASKEFLMLQHAINKKPGQSVAQMGLIKSMSNVLNVHPSSICKMVRKIIVREKAYEDFKEKVNELFYQLYTK